MIPGFLHRLNAELIHLVNVSTYINRLATKQFHFHSPPAQLNYTAWLGGKVFEMNVYFIGLFLSRLNFW
jgi:actin-related protein